MERREEKEGEKNRGEMFQPLPSTRKRKKNPPTGMRWAVSWLMSAANASGCCASASAYVSPCGQMMTHRMTHCMAHCMSHRMTHRMAHCIVHRMTQRSTRRDSCAVFPSRPLRAAYTPAGSPGGVRTALLPEVETHIK